MIQNKTYISEKQCVNISIKDPNYNKLNKLKKPITEAFFYWYKALDLKSFV